MNPEPGVSEGQAGHTLGQALQAARECGLLPLDAQRLLLHTLGKAQQGRAWLMVHQDRRNFSEALRKDPKAQPLLTETHGGWDTDAIDAMANANDIPDCATPRDM